MLDNGFPWGIRAYAEDAEPISPGDFIGRWMSLMAPAAEKVGARGSMSRADYLERMEKASVVNTLGNLKATGLHVGLLLNFNAPTLVIKCIVL